MTTSPSPLRVLIVDDNRSAADALGRVLRKIGHPVEVHYDGQSAINRLQEEPPDVVLTDLKMEPVDGLAVLKAARAVRPPVEVIVFTAFGGVDVAVKAMRLGARDFLTKPVTVEQVAQRLDAIRPSAPTAPVEPRDKEFIARSPASKELYAALQRAAGVPSPVWLEGEIGSGRGHAAWTIHRLGSDPTAPFTIRDVTRDLPWPTAGTVVLPNVDALPDDLQRALHRSLALAPPEIRLIVTAGPEARRLVTEGRLRSELFYALAVIPIRVPPLRERPEDVVPLLELAMHGLAQRYNRPLPVLDPNFVATLPRHSWPGNVRELLNVAERAVVMGVNGLDVNVVEAGIHDDLPRIEQGFDLAIYLEGVEKRILVEALKMAGGDRNRAGRLLGVERNTLRYKLNKYGLLDG